MTAIVVGRSLLDSRAEGNDRNVLVALADAAGHDGVTWLKVGNGKDDEERTICRLARVSKSTALRSIRYLRDELGEIETLSVRRGRSTVTVYRVLHGAVDVDYEDKRLDWIQPHRFEKVTPIHGVKLTPSDTNERSDEAPGSVSDEGEVHGVTLTPSIEPAAESSRCQTEDVHGVISEPFTVSSPRAREETDGTVREPSSRTQRENLEGSAAEAPVPDREVSELVLGLPGADSGSPRVVIPEAHGLPRSIVLDVFAKVRERGGRVGLLVDLLRIARAERTAAISAALARELGQNARAYMPAPWLPESLKRDDPERYVRVMATMPTFPLDLLGEALAGRDDLDALLELARKVRAGDEPGDRVGTPAEERRRWVEANARTDDAEAVIDAWHDVDDVERQELHDLVERIRSTPIDARRAAA